MSDMTLLKESKKAMSFPQKRFFAMSIFAIIMASESSTKYTTIYRCNNVTLQKKEQICEAKKEVIEDVQTPSMVEEPEPEEDDFAPSEQDEDYLFAENAFDDKKPMTEQDQIAFIRHHRCPRCGSELREKEGKYGAYIGCVRWNAPNDRCEYTASGTFASFTISKKFKPVVTPVKEIMEGQASLSMGNKPRQEREKRQS